MGNSEEKDERDYVSVPPNRASQHDHLSDMTISTDNDWVFLVEGDKDINFCKKIVKPLQTRYRTVRKKIYEECKVLESYEQWKKMTRIIEIKKDTPTCHFYGIMDKDYYLMGEDESRKDKDQEKKEELDKLKENIVLVEPNSLETMLLWFDGVNIINEHFNLCCNNEAKKILDDAKKCALEIGILRSLYPDNRFEYRAMSIHSKFNCTYFNYIKYNEKKGYYLDIDAYIRQLKCTTAEKRAKKDDTSMPLGDYLKENKKKENKKSTPCHDENDPYFHVMEIKETKKSIKGNDAAVWTYLQGHDLVDCINCIFLKRIKRTKTTNTKLLETDDIIDTFSKALTNPFTEKRFSGVKVGNFLQRKGAEWKKELNKCNGNPPEEWGICIPVCPKKKNLTY